MIAASRMLWIEREGEDIGVPVIFATPVEDRGAWRCDVTIRWPDSERAFSATGFDSVQALQLAMRQTAMELEMSPYHREGSLYFDEPGRDYGFPTDAFD
ncbi:MAG: hypothetical protein ABIY37_01755 [Devosia sp.]